MACGRNGAKRGQLLTEAPLPGRGRTVVHSQSAADGMILHQLGDRQVASVTAPGCTYRPRRGAAEFALASICTEGREGGSRDRHRRAIAKGMDGPTHDLLLGRILNKQSRFTAAEAVGARRYLARDPASPTTAIANWRSGLDANRRLAQGCAPPRRSAAESAEIVTITAPLLPGCRARRREALRLAVGSRKRDPR